MDKGDSLDAEFRKTVLLINNHTTDIGKYCDCYQCRENRKRLVTLGERMQEIGYQRKPMF